MRIGSFILGSLAGAAAVMYINKNKGKLWTVITEAALSTQKTSRHGKKSDAWSANVQTPSGAGSSKPAAPATAFASSTSATAPAPAMTGREGVKEVKEWINSDPALSATVQEILEHNNQQHSH